MTRRRGVCVGGPYRGREHIADSDVTVVEITKVRGGVVHVYHGRYEHRDTIWLWNGPEVESDE